jgi:FKBP-type peptidyl-prolyl cis-trans isomerase
MAKHDKAPSALALQLGEYIVPTIIAFAIIMSGVLTYYGINKSTQQTPTTAEVPTVIPTAVDADPFQIKTLKNGTGDSIKNNQKATVKYVGTLKATGAQFDAGTYSFTVGNDMVIQGWHEGILGMKVGEKRQLQIPASKGYGAIGNPPAIPANATLMFEVELLKIE